MPKTANSGFRLLNKLGPLVVEFQNRPYSPSGYSQGPFTPIFSPKFQNPGQLQERKLVSGVSPGER